MGHDAPPLSAPEGEDGAHVPPRERSEQAPRAGRANPAGEARKPRERSEHAPTPQAASLAGGRVLLVDDNAGTAVVLSGALQDAGAAVDVCRSADAAVAQAVRRLPAVVVIHLPLPKDAAAALSRRLRRQEALAGVRVVVLSGEEHPDEATVEAADALQTRPFSPPRLVADVARLMHS